MARNRYDIERRAGEALEQEQLAPKAWAARLAPEEVPDFSGFEIGRVYQAGSGLIEVLGRPHSSGRPARDEAFDYQGPDHKLTITLLTSSAEKAYESLIFREKNIPGGLKQLPDGSTAFETNDPDGVKILLREPEGE